MFRGDCAVRWLVMCLLSVCVANEVSAVSGCGGSGGTISQFASKTDGGGSGGSGGGGGLPRVYPRLEIGQLMLNASLSKQRVRQTPGVYRAVYQTARRSACRLACRLA